MRIGILEDDVEQQQLYKLWFGATPHECVYYTNAKDFLASVRRENFDLIMLDWMLPDSNGKVVLNWIRENLGWDIPVIFITALDSEADIVEGLRQGADDYVTKPPKYLELLARIESLSRRAKNQPIMKLGNFEINMDLRTISLKGQPIELTQKEFELACYVFQNPGKLMARVHLLDKLWGLNADVDTRTVDTHVSRIRRKLAITPENGWQILPVYGYGYRIERLDGQSAAS